MKKYLTLFLLFFLSYKNVLAKDKENYYFPYLSGNLLTEFNFTRMDSNKYGNKNYKDDLNLSYLQIESLVNVHLSNNILIKTNLLFKPFMGRMDNLNQYYNDFFGKENYMPRKEYFDRYDLVLEELAFEYKEEQFMFGLGKFNPTFGTAYDKSKFYPVFGTKIAEDYELTEKLGFYVAMTLPMLTLRANVFYNDDTFLSGSLFRNRDTYYNNGLYDKGVGNEHKLNNFSLTADFGIYDYRINAGFRRLSSSTDNTAEKGYLFGFERLIEETETSFGVLPFVEYAFIENYNGTKNRDMNYLTARLPLFYKNWNITPSYSVRLDRESGFKNYKSYLTQISIGYKFNNGIMVDVSKNLGRESYKTSMSDKYSYKVNSTDFRLSYMLIIDDK